MTIILCLKSTLLIIQNPTINPCQDTCSFHAQDGHFFTQSPAFKISPDLVINAWPWLAYVLTEPPLGPTQLHVHVCKQRILGVMLYS